MDNKFQFLLEKIRRNKGVDFSLYREGTLKRRIDSRLRTTGCADYLEYISYLNRNPEEYDRLLEAVTINVTEFFRNPETFHAIQHKVLPEIIKNKLGLRRLILLPAGRANPPGEPLLPRRLGPPATLGVALRAGRDASPYLAEAVRGQPIRQAQDGRPRLQPRKTIRAWCAGTSYGEETYSVAILFLQLLQERIADYNIKVIGTDIDPDCIAKAKTGLYEPSHLKEVNKNILNKYFHREGENFRVKDEVKHLTEFKIHDLTHCQPQADPPVAENFEDATREAQRNKIVIPAGLLRHSKALGYEGWKAGIQSQNKYLDSHFHGNDRKRDKQLKNVDLILCRNVVIYFTKPLQELVYGLFLKSLNQGGFLVLGKVESLGGYAQGFFEALDNKERIYRKM